ncbi:MAG: efflux RND transporter periplasmic adaptor subunit [Acidobacteriales bacterium]|nr:efflux RND transporter periplasmic adaptor subunit [Terriglobales bacterium]
MLVLDLVLASCAKKAAEADPAVPVQVVAVKKTSINRIIEAAAVLYPLQQSAIVPKISAPVKQFYVTRGSFVHRGQLLATLENRDLAAAAQDTKGTYDQAQATYQTTTAADLPEAIQKAQLDVKAAKGLLEAQEKVFKSRQELFQQGALPRKELDQSNVDVTSARNQYEIAQNHLQSLMTIGKQGTLKSAAGQLESAKGKYAGAEAQLAYSEIRSPIDGVITDRPLYPGEMATAGTPLLTVMDISQIIARAHISQQDAASLKVKDKATITAPGADPVEGKVTMVSPALDPNSTTVEIWVQAKNPGNSLRPGSSVNVSMLAETVPDALVVPAVSLLAGEAGAKTVMVVGGDGRAHQRTVQVGIRQGNKVQILDGLHAGDKVITEGAYGLADNSKIEVREASGEDSPADKSGAKTDESNDKK